MAITVKELEMYRDFDELASDVLDLASEVFPDKLIYLTSINDKEQTILKLSTADTSVLLTEGMVININETVCNQINFKKNRPLVYENTGEGSCPNDLRNLLDEVNIKSYLGLPISLSDGERFGTLCVAHHEESVFDKKSIELLQKIVRMFSYYLNLEYFAFKDSLTDLYNRRYLNKFFELPSSTGGVLFIIDLDGFKKINDIHGHESGDLVLIEVALRIKRFLIEYNDAFAVRLGGDEFIIHFTRISPTEKISKRAEQVLNSLSSWNSEYQLSASIGIVTYPNDHNIDLKMLLKNADNALYRAKKAGKNTYNFF